MKRKLLKAAKILLWVIASVIILVVLLAVSLNIPAVQNFVKNRVVHYVAKKTHTVVTLESIKIAFPKDVVLQKFYLEDLSGDTLLYANRLSVDISLFKLLKNQVEIKNIELENMRANVKRIEPDSNFNFSFLVDAFMSDQKKPDEQVKKDSTSALKFSIDKFSFKDVGINYRDDLTGNNVQLHFGEFSSKINSFDIQKQNFDITSVLLSDASLRYNQRKPLEQLAEHLEDSIDSGKVKAKKLPLIKIGDLNLRSVHVDFDDQTSDTRADLKLTELTFSNLLANLEKMRYSADGVALNKSKVSLAFKPAPKTKSTKTDTTVTSPLSVTLKKLSLSDNQIQFDNLSEKATSRGMDFNHLLIQKLNVSTNALHYSADTIAVQVNSASFIERSGFKLDRLAGNVSYLPGGITLDGFILQTPNTRIVSKASVLYSSVEDLTKYPEKVKVSLNVNNSVIGLRDIAYFNHSIPANYRNLKLKINTVMKGTIANLEVPTLTASGLTRTAVNISGRVKGLPDVKKAFMDIQIKNLATSRADILAIMPVPSNITLPAFAAAKGRFKGSMHNFNTHLDIRSDMGNASLTAQLQGPKGREKYIATVTATNLDAGRLLRQQPKLGRVSFKAQVSGTGLDARKANATFKANINRAYYNQYTYKNIALSGRYANQHLTLKGKSTDDALNFNLTATANLGGTYPQIATQVELTEIDLQKLHFSTSEFKVAGTMKADFKTADIDFLNGNVFATGLQVVKDGKRFNVDTIVLTATSTAMENSLLLRSEFARVQLQGKYQLTKLGSAFVNQINKYYAFGTVTNIPDQRVAFSVNLYNPKILKDFLPDLKNLSPANFSGLLDTRKDSLRVNGWLPQITYGDYSLDSTRLIVGNASGRLNYQFNIRRVQSPSIQLYYSEISGSAANNLVDVSMMLRDNRQKDRYSVAGTFTSMNKDFRFSLLPGKLLLNYQPWTVAPDNYLQFGASGILAHQFHLSQNEQLIQINSQTSVPNSPMDVTIKNLRLETITNFAQTDSTLLGGTLNGTALVRDIATSPKFEGTLSIAQLRYKKDVLGDLRMTVNNLTTNAFEVNGAITGVHSLRVNGFYYTAPQSALDLTLHVDKLDLSAAESISGGQIRNGTGNLKGDFTIKGNLDAPKILGNLKFNQAGFNIKYVNSYFRIPDEQIDFTTEGIRFNNFTLIDSLNKTAVVDGMVYTSDYRKYRFDLSVKADNFRVLHSTAADNELIYGLMYISTNVQIKGDMNEPVVNGYATINDGTKFFFALPADDPSVIEQGGIVQFIDEDAPPFNGKKALNVDSLTRAPLKGMNLSVNIDIDKNAELNVVVDPANGDALRVKGQGSLNATVDPSGKTSLTGRYDLTDGSYNLSVGGLARKDFKIQSGSSIIWTGEPTTAEINITALYEVNTAAIDLVADQVETMDASVRNTYKQKLPFQVFLHLTGELMKPTIAFKLDLPENERGGTVGYAAFTRLQQINQNENQLNKQVFALLALNRFISDNPFESLAGGTTTSTLARQSVSRLLTEQLNNLASDLIKGVDINIGLKSTEDYSSGSMENRTDLEVGLTKKLLNDRLTISVGSNFGIEGNRPANQSSSNIAGNINVEYLLSADGRYRLRFYRRNQTEAVVEGQIIETGVGFALVVDYNRFREIFRRSGKKVRLSKELPVVETIPQNNDEKKP